MSDPYLCSVQIGPVRTYDAPKSRARGHRPWTTGIYKHTVTDPIWLSTLGLAGDQHHFHDHGGPDKALLAYAAEHYPAWEAELGLAHMPAGGFGENFTIAGLTEATVCVGDTYAVGPVRVQVTQPRQPCTTLARRWDRRDLVKLVQKSRRTGWYLRVLTEGYVESDMPVVLLERPYPDWTVARATEVMGNRGRDRASALELSTCPLLSTRWRESLQLPARR
jgi:MOSC domain-containing protein YiiM